MTGGRELLAAHRRLKQAGWNPQDITPSALVAEMERVQIEAGRRPRCHQRPQSGCDECEEFSGMTGSEARREEHERLYGRDNDQGDLDATEREEA